MSKPINPTRGACPCPICKTVSDVRRMKNDGPWYLVCPECGTVRPTGARFQDYIMENATLYGAEGAPEPAPAPTPAPAPRAEPKPAPRQARESEAAAPRPPRLSADIWEGW